MVKFLSNLRALFDLRSDTDYERTDEAVRNNVDFRSANAWTLVFAIFVASVGLNVNSTAVIIGAMLISPLMGPIVGAGFGLGVNDPKLVKRAGRNLLNAVLISIATSTLYFIISPFDEAQSELLARTAPNFYDVLIAFFGGAAGIVALSRKEKSNAIPGVAIATALMPPLCTVGFGLANLNWKFALGALYLFVINCVFICLTTYIFVRYLRFAKVEYADKEDQGRQDRWIFATATIVIVPSLVTAWLLLQESTFKAKATQFIDKEIKHKGTLIVDRDLKFSWKEKTIHLQLVGTSITETQRKILDEKKELYGLQNTTLVLDQVSLVDEIDRRMARRHQLSTDQGGVYRQQMLELEKKIEGLEKDKAARDSGEKELRALNPDLLEVNLSDDRALLAWRRTPSKKERAGIDAFLRVRLQQEKLSITHALKL